MTPEERRIKKAAKAKRYREKLKADPERKAILRARHNEWRRKHRAEHGSYPTQEHLDKAAAYNRKRYHEKLKNDPKLQGSDQKDQG